MSHLSIDKVVDLIRRRGALRTPALATEFGCTEPFMDAALAHRCESGGPLVSCDVELAGGVRVKEYRASTIGGGELKDVFSVAPGRPRKAVLHKPNGAFGTDPKAITEALGARFQKPLAAAPEVKPMKTTQKILQALGLHGPMTLPELRKHVKGVLTPQVAQLRSRGELVRLGGGERTSIYGLPGQRAVEKASTPSGDHKLLIGEIEADVPPPPRRQEQGAVRKALGELKPGQSRLISGCRLNNIYRAAERSRIKVRTRRELGGFRVWRIA